jgi:hypothetical protein
MADHRFGSVCVAVGCQRRSTETATIVGQITTNLNSTPPIVVLTPLPTTTTTTAPKGCAQYVADAITAGWPADQAPMLARVMFRESRCITTAYNGQDTSGGSYGLATNEW